VVLTQLRRAVDRLIDLSAALGALALIVIAAIVVIDVVGRYFGAPLHGAMDIQQMAAVFVVFGGMAYCDRQGRHIVVDLLEPLFPKMVNRLLATLGTALGALVFALIAWHVWEASKLSIMLNLATNILQLPRAPFQYVLVAFSALTSITMALRFWAMISDNSNGRIQVRDQ
jgi:TRAP-type C4-dicarboxylate transport system permease small subunit